MEFVNAASRVLAIEMPGKHGTVPLWWYGCIGFFILIGWIASRSAKSRHITTMSSQVKQLANRPLKAVIFFEDAAGSHQLVAKLETVNGQYLLQIEHTLGDVATQDRQQLITLSEVESYLEKKTVFRLSDFKPQI